MKTPKLLSLYLVFLLMIGAQMALSEGIQPGVTPIDSSKWFSWLNQTTADWKQGGLLLLMGFVGSLVTIFGLIGGSIPGIAGQVKIDKGETTLELLMNKLEQLIDTSVNSTEGGFPQTIKAVQETVNNLRDDLRKERWRQFSIAIILYAFLGAVFAAMLADDLLEAMVIGAGWTGLIGSLGLKKDYTERKAIKDESAKETMEVIKELVQQSSNHESRKSATDQPLTEQPVVAVRRNSSINLAGILDASRIDPEVQKWISKVNNNAIVANKL